LSKKAINIGLDASSNVLEELKNCMNSFISKYIPKGKEKVTCKRNISQQENEDKISNSSFSDKKNFIEIENLIKHKKLENQLSVNNAKTQNITRLVV
ncbi:19071_t:CDS:2, partial [Racocetra persica]